MKKRLTLFAILFSLATTTSAQLDSKERKFQKTIQSSAIDSLKIKQTVGVAIDLLPPILSATSGDFGYSAQLWYGYKKFRIRGVIAGFTTPDKIMGNDDFTDLKTTATALIFDYFLKNNFKGWWFGSGIEKWDNTITSHLNDQDYGFKNYVSTAGSGYIFKIYKNFYVEPWGAIHYVMDNNKIAIENTEYKPKKIQGELSCKIGWHF